MCFLFQILYSVQDNILGVIGQMHSISRVGVGEIPLLGEMSAKQTKGFPNSENFAPAAGFDVN